MKSLTIGEVLNELKNEFDDVTISKIRYLESEGLIEPDRTQSGYRKFRDEDLERLRYVLRAQRDRYLPLKVIRKELDRLDAGLPINQAADGNGAASARTSQTRDIELPLSSAESGDDRPDTVVDLTDAHLTLSELCDATGLEERDVADLQSHGILGEEPPFDGADLVAARLAAGLMKLGLEPRHLRMYRQFADREAALYEQLVSPLLRQRNPESRAAASEHLDDLHALSVRMHDTLLSQQLQRQLRS